MMDLIVDFPRRRSRTQGVSFADHLEVKIIKNLSHEHKDDLWFTEHDIRRFKRRVALMMWYISSIDMTVSQYAKDNIHDTSAFLGLERYLSENTAKQTRYRRRAIRKAVLLEQRHQMGMGIHDPETIAEIAVQMSGLSRKRACIIGLLHAENNTTYIAT